MTTNLRPAAVAGSFYPADPVRLAADVDRYLAAAPEPGDQAPKAIIVPHAGYVYSGPVAASAFRSLAPARERIRRVLVLGPAHRVAVRGLALPGSAAFETPLGQVPIDEELAARLAGLPQVAVHARCHEAEHSIEVQLPFLQRVLREFTLLPLVVGQATATEVAEVLRAVWGGPETLIVISSDLSHYLPYSAATAVDRSSVERILDGEATLTHDQACGATPVNGLLTALRGRDFDAALVDLRNSGDTAGDRQAVVGYASVLFTARPPESGDARYGRTLLALARAAITEALGARPRWPPRDEALEAQLLAPGAAFVTLMLDGRLRGCIGSLEATQALHEDVVANAVAAAQSDPRFIPLRAAELPHVKVEVSVLSPPAALTLRDEDDAYRQLRPGIDGILLEAGRHRATFLPQVWSQLPTPQRFLAELKRKAGLPEGYWAAHLRLSRYTVRKWSEA